MGKLPSGSKCTINRTLQELNVFGSFAVNLLAFPSNCMTVKLSLSTRHQSQKHAFSFFFFLN